MSASTVQTAIRFDPGVHARLVAAAEDHTVSVNWIVQRAVADFLDRLLPADQVVWTRDQLDDVRYGPVDPDPEPTDA